MTEMNIAVVGAGLAGLAAALRLEAQGQRVTLFEARERVGGRVWTENLGLSDGSTVAIERGAEFIIDGYDEFKALTERFGLELVDTGMSYYEREPVDVSDLTLEDLSNAGRSLANELTEFDYTRPVDELLAESALPPDIQEALRARIEISTALPSGLVAGDALMHAAAFHAASSWRIRGGNQLLPHAMSAALGAQIRFNEEVTSVRTTCDGITLDCTSGKYDFDACVIAVPLEVLRTSKLIREELSSVQKSLLDRIQQGHAAKFHAALVSEPAESATMSVNDRYWSWTARENDSQVGRVLNGFMGSGPAINRLLNDVDPEKKWLEKVRSIRPDLDFDLETSPVFTNWKEDSYALGAYSGRPPGLESHALDPVTSVGSSIVLAGEYLGEEMIGLMEGAIRSGYNAAHHLSQV